MSFGLLDGHDVDLISHGPPGDMNHEIRPLGQQNEGADVHFLVATTAACWEIFERA